MEFIRNKPSDRTKPPVLDGWVQTLKGLFMTKHRLNNNLSHEAFSCRMYNQDPLDF